MFWSGAAPTRPGIPLIISTPLHPISTAWATKSSHSTPASTTNSTSVSPTGRLSIPPPSTTSTVPAKPSSEITTLVPPPSTSRDAASRAGMSRRAAAISARLPTVRRLPAGPPTRSDVSSASERDCTAGSAGSDPAGRTRSS